MGSWPRSGTKGSGTAWIRQRIVSRWSRPGSRGTRRGKSGDVRVLITGTDGYIGCLLAPMIMDAGHEVVGLDTNYFSEAQLGAAPRAGYRTIAKDLRDIERSDLEGIDAVMHLAGLSNDALGQLSRRVTFDINHRA